jgi:hypothetical protein
MPLLKSSFPTPPEKFAANRPIGPPGQTAELSREGFKTSTPAASRWHGLGGQT